MNFVSIVSVLGAVLGCSGEGGAGPTPRELARDGHWYPSVSLGGSEEITGLCQSWAIGNETDVYVNGVRAVNDGGWHHSNWIFVPDALYGPDGSWDCADRGFSEAAAAGLDSGVFFAQSTQARDETMQFGPGFAFRLPARSRIIGGVHLLNTGGSPLETRLGMEIIEIPMAEAEVLLAPMSFTYTDLAIAARSESQFVMECEIGEQYMRMLGRMPDFSFYYVVPHYHSLGTLMRLELVGGENDGSVIFETNGRVGDPLGERMEPPVAAAGAHAIRLTCGYDNPRPERVGYGVGDQEMCVFLAYTDSPLKFAGAGLANSDLGVEAGVHMNESPCTLISVPSGE